jgi:hypothetical protein
MFRSGAAKALRGALAGAALAGGLAATGGASAATYFLQSASMNTTYRATIAGPGVNATVYSAPVVFHAYNGTGPVGEAFDLLAFCVDIFHAMSLGTVNLTYDDAYDLTTNSYYNSSSVRFAGPATALSEAQVTQVGHLVNFGTDVWENMAAGATKDKLLAGLQGAVWKTINPTYSITSSTAAVNTHIINYSGAGYLAFLDDFNTQAHSYTPVSTSIDLISQTGRYGFADARQAFAIAVPEPATWATMIMGFAALGAVLRRRRSAPAFA